MNDPQPLVQDRLAHNSWGFLGSQGYILGMDIGGYGLRAALRDVQNHTYHRTSREISGGSANQLLAASLEQARELMRQYDVAPERLVRIGVGFAGPVDARRGIVQRSHRISGWEQFPLKDHIEDAFGAVTLLDNDANLIALGEATFGVGHSVQNLFYLHLSSGVGGGLVLNGRLYHGATTMAGEVGHAVVGAIDPIYPNEPPRTLEQRLSISGILQRAAELGHPTNLLSDIFSDAQIGPQIIGEAADLLAVRLSQIIALIDPEMIILGGVVARQGGDALIAAIKTRIPVYMASLIERPVQIVPSVLGFESVSIGALALALESLRD
ncbi:ROK family transcriptional regulator [Kouleothrix aurantiaca]|uniref:ROK family transcriptional regulator n=1 Tax=Kouleothrix aurantiaca TaxID=186479 RepID=A0A0P9D169_9CHLR|nr:ROK family transcriptional regulator [Kouleothrix aurantiaca]